MKSVLLACILLAATTYLRAAAEPSPEAAVDPWLKAAPPVPELAVPATATEWRAQREQVRATLWRCLGKLPPRPRKLDVTTLSREDRGDYVLERFSFDNGAGATVPGTLLLPKGADGSKKAPAVLYCHWHGSAYGGGGKAELFHAGTEPVNPGPGLAKAGFVVLAIDSYCFGERDGQGPGGPKEVGAAGEMTAAKFNLWVGRTLWGMIVRDDQIALDYLCSRPEVDPARVGVTGASMGATRTWWLMALDDRPKTGAAVVCMTRYQDLVNARAMAGHGIYYYVPGLLEHFDTEAVIACVAPRPILFQNGEKDTSSPVAGVRKIESVVGKVYGLYGDDAAKGFKSIVYKDVGHEYTAEMWATTQRWLTEQLTPGGGK